MSWNGDVGGGLDPDVAAVTARIDEQIAQAQQHAEQMQEWSNEVDSLTAEGSALRGNVRVSVNHSGVVQSVSITDAGCDAGAAALSTGVMDALQAAYKAVGDAVARSAASRFGQDAELTRLMVDDLSTRLGVSIDPSPEDPRRRYPDGRIG
ncbi:MAG TPA: YbaB/EbfC family nucleoid-associated protein [Lapillicoccus sp.]